MAYTVETTDGLTKWWFTGTSTDTNNRLSDLMDDQPDGPFLNTGDIGAWTQTGGTNEWYMTVQVKPDGETAGQDVWCTINDEWLTNNDGGEGSLNASEWAYNAGTNVLTIRLQNDEDPNGGDPLGYYAWSNFMTEVIVDGVYTVHLDLDIGDGTISTTLESEDEMVWFDSYKRWFQKNNSTLTMDNVAWRMEISSDSTFTATSNATWTVTNSNLMTMGDFDYTWNIATMTFTDVTFNATQTLWHKTYTFTKPVTFTRVKFDGVASSNFNVSPTINGWTINRYIYQFCFNH